MEWGRKSSREADDPTVPDWPNEQACPCCGKPCWLVEAEDGSEVLIDTAPMDTELETDLYGEVRRVRAVTSYVHPDTYAVSGWRLLDPVRVIGQDEGWYWYASRVRLAADDERPLYSEHIYVCQRVSAKVIEGLLSAVPFVAPVNDQHELRAKRVAMKQKRVELEEWVRAGNTVPLASELKREGLESATQLQLFC